MYQYRPGQRSQLALRARQFGTQVDRFLAGELDPAFFQQLRLRNGLYIERHAPMLRVAIPYGTLSSGQLRKLAHIARTYDRGYGHFTTRQNIQFNWPALESVPTILADLAEADIHAIQTSGSCIRNITTDHLAGVAEDEHEDPRPWCELLRQWSTLHPEFNWLPRKFKIAVSGARDDRAVIRLHDIGLRLHHDANGESVFEVIVGGGMGRTPVIGKTLRESLPGDQLLPYLQSILRIYNLNGRRDHKYRSRIKILVNDLGPERFQELVEEDFAATDLAPFSNALAELESFREMFAAVRPRPLATSIDEPIAVQSPAWAQWLENNTLPHRESGFRIVMLSLKSPGEEPGNLDDSGMDLVADLAEEFGNGEIRVSHEQNLVLPWVPRERLYALWQRLDEAGLATANIGTAEDMICCPGLDYCSLANASTIPIAAEIQQAVADFPGRADIGPLRIKMSGCMNACGHHHVGDIGILGVDKKGKEFYQVTLGGRAGNGAKLGERLGPAIAREDIAAFVMRIIERQLELRQPGETLADTVERIGVEPFKEKLYADRPVRRQAA